MSSQPSTILIVEDDPVVRMLAIDIVEDSGFVAIDAEDADNAIALLEANPQVGLVFSDIEMPGTMNGVALAAYVRQRWPAVELVLTSGRVAPTASDLPTDSIFLPKPYRPAQLAGVLNRMLSH